jgi:3-hydroxyacyl-CoA dehydrogenase
MRTRQIRKVAVLGSGVMGSAIAAHFANAGIPSLVLDIVPRELDKRETAAGLELSDPRVRNRIARESVKALAKTRPSPLFSASRLGMIETGNLEDDLARLSDADWVIEVVREDMKIKKKVFAAIAPHLRDDVILTSNTSGLSLAEMSQSLPENVRPRFMGTHFFNPPRYMRLLELIPAPETSDSTLEWARSFCAGRLGKGVVVARDTPNFIANRIGTHAIAAVLKVMEEMDLTIEEADALTGPPMERPKTGTFRLADLVGVDTLTYVLGNMAQAVPDDESRDMFAPPKFMLGMVKKGLLGRKAGAGFYKKVKKKILTLDLETLEYREPIRPEFSELAALKKIRSTPERLRTLMFGEGRGSTAAWKILAATLSYSAMRLSEIADQADTLDQAVELGFNWKLGPFRTWDMLGFRETTERLRKDGYPLPEWVDALYDSGAKSIYSDSDGQRLSATGAPGVSVSIPIDPRVLDLDTIREGGGVVLSNDSASLLDLGDGVLCLEFHTKMNAIDRGLTEMIRQATEFAECQGQAMVLANNGTNFCAGANLMMLVGAAREGEWEAIRGMVTELQSALNQLESCSVPVVVAPHGMALGGGAEIVLAGNAIRAYAELYVGLVEVGAGLIPAGGGCLRLYKRHVEQLPDEKDLYPALKAVFEAIGMAKVATSAEEGRDLGFLRPQDTWSMNRTYLISDAKALAVAMAQSGFVAPVPRRDLPVMGRGGKALIETALYNMHEGHFISEHDLKIGSELAGILSGGDLAGITPVSESYILELETEAFLRLCGEPKTQERIVALLETGKPLRN